MNEQYELTILMPCLNESETLAVCIGKAKTFLEKSGVRGEIVIADNGSTDGSQQIARENGARVVNVPEKGYGAALIGGCNDALGKYVIMGDADDSYDFLHLNQELCRRFTAIWEIRYSPLLHACSFHVRLAIIIVVCGDITERQF